MEIGLFGLPRSGKTTLFEALTGAASAGGGGDANVAVVNVPDERFGRLVQVFNPKKIVPATVRVVDVAGVSAGEGKGISVQVLSLIGTTDALCAVVRGFDDGSGIAPNPASDLDSLLLEMTLSDLQKVENRIERLGKQANRVSGAEKQAADAELEVLKRIHAALEANQPIRDLNLPPEEAARVRGFQFLSQKPLLLVVNAGEDLEIAAAQSSLAPALGHQGVELIVLNADLEREIARLDSEEERQEFLRDFGLAEPARERLIQRLYALLGLISFFTVSEKEVHAWTTPAGTAAPRAAGVIHSDLERGFIRAEVVGLHDFFANGSSMAEVKKAGKFRLEGKSYAVQDGDIFHVHFSA